MKASVVITTFNRRSSLERCLGSLAPQSFPGEEWEVIVVADGCTDDSVDYLRTISVPFKLRWFDRPNQGQPAAQNFGVANASGNIVIFLDDDCICEPGWVAAHCETHAQGGQIVGVGAILYHADSPAGTLSNLKLRLAESEYQRLLANGADLRDMMLCANSSIARSAALDTSFDPSFERIHDVEAGQRLLARGFRPVFVSQAIVYELFTKSIDGALRDSWLQGKNEVILTARSPRFKPLAGIGLINQGSPFKRISRKALALHPRLSEVMLRPAFMLAEALRPIPPFASFAARILQARLAIQLVAGAIRQAGAWVALEGTFGKHVPVLMYHNVGDPRPGEYPGLTTPVVEFENQIRFLAQHGYQTITPSDWLRWREAGGTLPQRPVMLVFDDAYEEASQNAFPILERAGYSAACMVVTGCIGSTNRWDEEAGRPSFPLMNADQILDWSRRGIEFGGHTRSHPFLPDIPGERVEAEIGRCAEDLTTLLGDAQTSFAYPFGGFSTEAEKSARRHFRMAFSVWPGVLHLGSNPYLVPRIAFLPGETRFGMSCRLRLGKNPFEVARNRWRRLFGHAPEAKTAGAKPIAT